MEDYQEANAEVEWRSAIIVSWLHDCIAEHRKDLECYVALLIYKNNVQVNSLQNYVATSSFLS